MKLTRLELSGFKSFADTVTLTFEQGVTAIVGPNGCGKSNVSDSVRWVLGEQSARLLRGGKMEDVIFQGSTARRPVNVTEVSLYLDNSDGDLPIAYREVVVTRRLSRSGQSDYLLNGSPVRLRDIQDLLRGTGLGSDAGVVIEAKMIDLLLSDRAEERRSLFEEAAGIGLYRDRKHSTERRLEETATDLQRVEDLIAEVQSQIRSLARQRGKAERHAKLTEEKFAVQVTLARRLLERLSAEAAGMQARFEELAGLLPAAAAAPARSRAAAGGGGAGPRGRGSPADRDRAAARRSSGWSSGRLDGDLALAAERLANTTARRHRAEEERPPDGAPGAAGAARAGDGGAGSRRRRRRARPHPRRADGPGGGRRGCAPPPGRAADAGAPVGAGAADRRPRRSARSKASGPRSKASSRALRERAAGASGAPRPPPGRAGRRRAPAGPCASSAPASSATKPSAPRPRPITPATWSPKPASRRRCIGRTAGSRRRRWPR